MTDFFGKTCGRSKIGRTYCHIFSLTFTFEESDIAYSQILNFIS